MKFICSVAVVAATILTPALVAAQGTAEQKNACMGDAFQFCGDYIPDATKIEACLRKNVKIISPECGAQFKPMSQRAKLQPTPVADRHGPY